MEKAESIPILWMSAAYAVMIAAKMFLVEPTASYVGFSSIMVFMGGTVAQDVYARLAIAEYGHLIATVRPSWQRAEFFFVNFESKSLGNDRFLTTVYLGLKYLHLVYGKVDRIFILHALPWKARIKLRHGKATHLGVTVPHGQTDYVTLYEKEPYVDHAQRYPVYDLVEGGGDLPYMLDVIKRGLLADEKIVAAAYKDAGVKREEVNKS